MQQRHLGVGVSGPIFLELLDTYKDEKERLFSMRQPSLMEAAIRQSLVDTQHFLRQHPEACLVQSDKGNKTCLMLLAEYEAKMEAYIAKCVAKGVYRLVDSQRVKATKNIFQDLRSIILAAPIPQDEVVVKLCNILRYFHNAKLPSLYGTVKCHKPDTPIRPICSTVAWYSRPIQKILCHLLTKYFRDALCRQNVVRVDDVAKEVATLRPRPGYVFTKLDVTDMYGSMDKGRIVQVLDRLLTTIEEEGRSLYPKELVMRMVRFSLEQSCIVGYQKRVYVQLMGLPQGACDSGLLATIYLDYVLQLHHEELFVAHRVLYWRKYMDDFLLYMPKQNIQHFKHQIEFLTGLGFETEPEEELKEGLLFGLGVVRTMPFLDLSIHTMKDGQYLLSKYKKPIASSRMIHALSNTVFAYKVNAINGYLHTIFKRTSNEFLVHDLDQLRSQILANGYSENLVECLFYKAIVDEVDSLQQTSCIARVTDRITLLHDYKAQLSLDMRYHYKTIRQQYVSLSKQPGYRFQFRSIGLSRLVFAACQYANMPPPIYCRPENSDVFQMFLGHKRMQAACCYFSYI